MVIYLILLLPAGFSDLPKNVTGSHIVFCSVLLRMGFTCALSVTRQAVVSYTAFPPLHGKPCGLFLLHCPWSRLRQMLSGTLPFEARTFLSCILSVMQQRPSVLLRTSLLYHNFFRMSIPPFWHFLLSLYTFRQLPPINSRIMEFFGMISLSIPRK